MWKYKKWIFVCTILGSLVVSGCETTTDTPPPDPAVAETPEQEDAKLAADIKAKEELIKELMAKRDQQQQKKEIKPLNQKRGSQASQTVADSGTSSEPPPVDLGVREEEDAVVSLIDQIYQQLKEYQAMGIPPIRDERNDELIPRIFFDYDKSTVKSEFELDVTDAAKKVLDELAQRGTMHLQIEGHADDRGSSEYNVALGRRRANSVQQLLSIYTHSPNLIKIVSYGEERPAALGENEEAWSQNRRVEFTLMLNEN